MKYLPPIIIMVVAATLLALLLLANYYPPGRSRLDQWLALGEPDEEARGQIAATRLSVINGLLLIPILLSFFLALEFSL